MSAHESTPDDARQHQRPEGGGGGCDGHKGPVEAAHGLALCSRWYGGARRSNALRLAPQRRLNTVFDSGRQLIRPLVNRLVGDANSLGGGGDGSAEEFNGFGFEHASLNHSSRCAATMVPPIFESSSYRQTMVEKAKVARVKKPLPFGERLAHALSLPGNENGFSQLVKDLGVTRQAITKLLDGGSKEMGANNNAKAARTLSVDPIWLATGEGIARPGEFQVRWHERTLIEQFRELPPEDQEDVVELLRRRLEFARHHEGKRSADPFKGVERPRSTLISNTAPPALRTTKKIAK